MQDSQKVSTPKTTADEDVAETALGATGAVAAFETAPEGPDALSPGSQSPGKADWSSLYKKEDWWAVWIGLAIFAFSVPSYVGVYLLGWNPAGKAWTTLASALTTKVFNPWVGLLASFVLLTVILLPVARFNGVRTKEWLKGFALIFFASWAILIFANYKPVLNIVGSSELAYVFALVAGVAVTNLVKIPSWLKNSARGELFIKIAIVLLGAKILFTTILTSGPGVLAAALVSFPVVWFFAFFLSKKVGLDRNFSAVLSSAVGICGVSAAIATTAAIDAPPIYATVISSIVLIFAAVEIVVMPYVIAHVFPTHFAAAGVWTALSVKTDGAASASGAVVDGLLKANGSVLNEAVLTKLMIDVWIGLIAFLLAAVWSYRFRKGTGAKADPRLLWFRFPKFVLGYLATSALLTAIALTYPTVAAGAKAVAPVVSFGTDPFRVAFFVFAFLSIGLATRVSTFKELGLDLKKPVLVYAVSLLLAIFWGGVVAYLFFG
jgi:uncharacterized membrane protein YadS